LAHLGRLRLWINATRKSVAPRRPTCIIVSRQDARDPAEIAAYALRLPISRLEKHMPKLKINVEALKVDSFETSAQVDATAVVTANALATYPNPAYTCAYRCTYFCTV